MNPNSYPNTNPGAHNFQAIVASSANIVTILTANYIEMKRTNLWLRQLKDYNLATDPVPPALPFVVCFVAKNVAVI